MLFSTTWNREGFIGVIVLKFIVSFVNISLISIHLTRSLSQHGVNRKMSRDSPLEATIQLLIKVKYRYQKLYLDNSGTCTKLIN